MPRYFLDFTDTGELLRDYEGMELVDLESAHLEALAALGEIAKDQLRDGEHRGFVIDIREGASSKCPLTSSAPSPSGHPKLTI